MKPTRRTVLLAAALTGLPQLALGQPATASQHTDAPAASGWRTDFFDDFDTFNPDNWQDQRIWVNSEAQCYVPDGEHDTRVVSEGTLKLKVINIGEKLSCDNLDKTGKQHPDTEYIAGRICSKNRQEFIKGRWTARLRLLGSGQQGMFPAWWILGNRNNEPPVQQPDENVAWPLEGSGEIDIFEHHGDGGPGRFTTGAIKDLGDNTGDWWSLRTEIHTDLDVYHEYTVEWAGSDLVYRVDGAEVYRNAGEGDNYPEAMFAILNYAKINDAPMTGEWAMEVDWVKHESWDERFEFTDLTPPASLELVENDETVSLNWDTIDDADLRFNVYRSQRPGEPGDRVASGLKQPRFEDEGPSEGETYYYTVSTSLGSLESGRSDVVQTAPPFVPVPARLEAEHCVAMNGVQTETCGDADGGLNLGFIDAGDTFDFNIRVQTAGDYTMSYRVASLNGSQGFEVLVDDRVADRQTVPATGGWQNYVTLSSPTVSLAAGEHTLRFRSVGNEWNINWVELTD